MYNNFNVDMNITIIILWLIEKCFIIYLIPVLNSTITCIMVGFIYLFINKGSRSIKKVSNIFKYVFETNYICKYNMYVVV